MLTTKRYTIVVIFLILSAFCHSISSSFLLAAENTPTWAPTPEERANQGWIPKPDEVMIGPNGVSVPLRRILLVRKGKEYLALKFTNTWLGNEKYEHYTSYEFYHQGDGSGDFSKSDVDGGTRELFFPGWEVWAGHVQPRNGARDTIRFGAIKVTWLYISFVRYPKGWFVKGELAPTPWTSIAEVNVHDSRIKWYRKDSDREAWTVPIDQFWHRPSSVE